MAEDGLLTAEDVAGLNLHKTELVTLSACETGLGEARHGEGVFGLRRAFALAGAKTLVMSLWKVPDEQTRQLMEDFYLRLLRGQGRVEALREAQLAIKSRHPDPFYWGGFICEGIPTPIPQFSRQVEKPNARRGKFWYSSPDGIPCAGPVSTELLMDLIKEKIITPECKISPDGKQWKPASRLQGVDWPS
jgi:hypothetical protein